MIIIPEKKPVVQNLNSYYLDIKRLIEHYQGELGSGGIYFKSSFAEGAIFFDEDTILNGTFQNKESVYELAEELGILFQLRKDLAPWMKKCHQGLFTER